MMPSITHEALVLLFRNRPELAPELLRDVLAIKLPAYTKTRVEAADLSDVNPAEYRADLVVLLVDDKPVLAIVVEAQLNRDVRKEFTWPVYVTGLRARLECPACLLVVTPSESLADWARTPIVVGPGSTFVPFVVGPQAIPVVRDVEAAKRDPELVVLSAMAHGKGALGLQIATAALEACRDLDEERSLLYLDLVGNSLNDITRAAFEDLMANNYEFQTEFGKKHKAELDAEKAKGEALGEVRGKADSVLKFLATRGVAASAEQRERVLACTDLAVLDRWIEKAVTIASADELFAD